MRGDVLIRSVVATMAFGALVLDGANADGNVVYSIEQARSLSNQTGRPILAIAGTKT